MRKSLILYVLRPSITPFKDISHRNSLLSHKIWKFADDVKMGETVVTPDKILDLQNDIKNLPELLSKWNMKFNTDKFKVLQVQ